MLSRGGVLTRVRPDLFFAARVVDELRARLRAFLTAQREISAQQFKEMCGVSRKYVIPLAEFFDAEKLTLRVGDVRRLR
jgi:selenocysteine-specific elongation factor